MNQVHGSLLLFRYLQYLSYYPLTQLVSIIGRYETKRTFFQVWYSTCTLVASGH